MCVCVCVCLCECMFVYEYVLCVCMCVLVCECVCASVYEHVCVCAHVRTFSFCSYNPFAFFSLSISSIISSVHLLLCDDFQRIEAFSFGERREAHETQEMKDSHQSWKAEPNKVLKASGEGFRSGEKFLGRGDLPPVKLPASQQRTPGMQYSWVICHRAGMAFQWSSSLWVTQALAVSSPYSVTVCNSRKLFGSPRWPSDSLLWFVVSSLAGMNRCLCLSRKSHITLFPFIW